MSSSKPLNQRKERIYAQMKWSIGLGVTLTVMTFAFANLGKQMDQSSQPVSERLPASYDGKESIKEHAPFKHTFKLESPLRVHIEKEGELSIEPGEPFVLRGTFEFTAYTKQAEVEWVLPKGISMIQGQRRETLLDVPANTKKTVEVVLMSETDENRKIHFKVGIGSGKQRFAFSAQYNTTQQESINVGKAELQKRMQEYSEKTKQGRKFKVFK